MSRTELSLSDEWETPKRLFDWLCAKYRFYPNCDVAATEKNKKCDYYFGRDCYDILDQNGLNRDWYNKNWCNPPHSETELWVKKACQQFVEFGHETMGIITANATCTQYAEACIDGIAESYPIFERPKFNNPSQDKLDSAKNSYYVIIWRKL